MADNDSPAPPLQLDPEDFYYEGPYLVFTAAYHLKRGYCCGSGCRHCPYRGIESDRTDKDGDIPEDGKSKSRPE